MVNVLRSVSTSLPARETYLRMVFVLVGAALALALGVVDFTILALVAQSGTPTSAVAVVAVVLVAGPLAAGLIPAVRQVEGVAAQGLLGVRFPEEPPGPAIGWSQRRRTLGWFLVHVATGALVVGAVSGLLVLSHGWWAVPAAAATLLGVGLAGRLLAALAPVLLGPSYAERLARLQADASRATERTRIAREIHDSIGHALSLATVQATAARRLIRRDPAFAEAALETIETTTRRAAAELDHALGLLRDDPQRAGDSMPAPELAALDGLVSAARASGLSVESTVSGDLSRVPLPVSREAYRIVQEGLTNALKYSADATATLDLSLGAGFLEIRLTNPAGERRATRAGRGLRGIDERATTLGGSATVDADGGRWTVFVAVPAWEV